MQIDLIRRDDSRSGFTLIELLVVISILVVLAGLVVGMVTVARKKTAEARARSDIDAMRQAVEQYFMDVSVYPGWRLMADADDLETFNAFPELYRALAYDKEDGGGPGGPYLDNLQAKFLVVTDDEGDEGDFKEATKSEIRESDVPKYYYDPWGVPYFYRENKSKPSKKRHDWMIHKHKYDLWSCGPNHKNQSWEGLLDEDPEEEKNDDIGNW